MSWTVLFLCLPLASATIKMDEMFSWNVLDWNYPSEYSRQQAIMSGSLIPENALPVGVERWKNKLFVSVPRWKSGIPATLNYIPLDAPYDPSPKLNPYPNWKGNELGNCDTGLTTVYRIKADRCDRLWVLDVGTYGYDPNVTNVCPYALNVYDLKTDQRIRRYVFRPEDIVSTTFIANIAVDIGSSCDDAFAYFSDELGYGLIAYSWQQDKSWRFSHSFFFPDPLLGDFNIAGLNFQWGAEGIFGIALSPIGLDGYRTLYFSPLASHTEFSVSTKILRDESKVKGSYKDFHVVGVRGPDSHSTSKCISEKGVELFNLIDQNAIGCWNTAQPLRPQNIAIVDKDDNGLVFPCDVKIDDDEIVWVISDRMPVFLEAELDYSDINFRIYTARLDTLIQGTACEPAPLQQNVVSLPNMFNTNPTAISMPYTTGIPSVTLSPMNQDMFVPSILPRNKLLPTYNPRFSHRVPPKVTSYVNIDFPKSSSYPVMANEPNKNTFSDRNIWWYRDYEVSEHH